MTRQMLTSCLSLTSFQKLPMAAQTEVAILYSSTHDARLTSTVGIDDGEEGGNQVHHQAVVPAETQSEPSQTGHV